VLAEILWLSSVAAVPLAHHATLRWEQRAGAERCIDTAALADAVTARTRTDDAPAAELTISGVIEPASDGGWHATIRTTDERGTLLGERELRESSGDCHALDAKLVLVIALILEPDLLDRPVATDEPAPPQPPDRPPTVVERTSARARPWRFSGGLSGLAARGLLPGFGAGAMVALAVEPPWSWPIELAAVVWPYDRGDAAPGGATFSQLTAGAAICPPLVTGGWASACVGVQTGALRASGFGFQHDEHRTNAIADATAEVHVERQLTSSIAFRIGVAAWVPVTRPRFVFDRAGTDVVVYQPASVAGVTQIAIWRRF
jgi:hypothetical protein